MSHEEPRTLDQDVAWARRTLGPADPTAATPRPKLAPAVGMGTWPQVGPRRRRPSTPIGLALGAAAALVLAVVAVTVGVTASRHPATSRVGNGNLLAAYTRTVGAQAAHVSLSVTAGTLSASVDGAADLSTGNATFTATLPAPIGQVEAVSAGSTVYVRLPVAARALAGGKPWVAVDGVTLENLLGNQVGAPGLGATLSVTGVVAWLQGVTGNVAKVGTDTIHGTATTHYRAAVDLAKVAARAPADAHPDLDQLAQAAGQTVPVDVWIDSQGRLRQLRASVDLTKLHLSPGASRPAGKSGTAVVTIDLWDFGTAVHAVAPPSNQVSDLGPLISSLGLGG